MSRLIRLPDSPLFEEDLIEEEYDDLDEADDEAFSERPEPDYEAWVEERAMREWDDDEQARRDWEAEERGMRLRGEL